MQILFTSDTPCESFLKSGWSSPELYFVWSNGEASVVEIPLDTNVQTLEISLVVTPYLPSRKRFRKLQVNINEVDFGSFILRGRAVICLALNKLAVESYKNVLTIHLIHAEADRPCDNGESKDERRLGIALHEIVLRPLTVIRQVFDSSKVNILAAKESVPPPSILSKECNRLADQVLSKGTGEKQDLRLLVNVFIDGAGVEALNNRKRVSAKIVQLAIQLGFASSFEEVFDDRFIFARKFIADLGGIVEDNIYNIAPSNQLAVLEILPASEHEPLRWSLPVEISSAGQRYKKTRGALNAYCAEGAIIYFSHNSFQVYDPLCGSTWRVACPQSLSKSIQLAPKYYTAQPVVMCQDSFDGRNLAHFLFDHLTRAGHFIEKFPEIARDALFVFGGVPGGCHQLLLDAFCKLFSISAANIIFPSAGVNVESKVGIYWFSDIGASAMHPCQIAHPASMELFNKLAGVLGPFRSVHRYIYISRSDAQVRRLANESELLKRLIPLGFRSIVLSGESFHEQLNIVCGAEFLIAPHGMGLTHLALHSGRFGLIELFNPGVGSDAYAEIIQAKGACYKPIIGVEVDFQRRDFTVDVDSVVVAFEEMKSLMAI